MTELQLTLEEKIGQMLICGFDGLTPNDHIQQLIEKHHIGGVIYFSRNYANVKQIADLSYELQQMNAASSQVPLFVSIDQEGGMVARIDNDEVTLVPGNMSIGASRDDELAYEAAVICAKELRQMGINVNFAPSLDINNNPKNPVIGVRSYGENADLVSELGIATIEGYQSSDLAATAKHFPGHGDTAVDSHYGLASVPHNQARLMKLELAPFIRAIQAGVDMIMTAHVMFPAFEPEQIPATLSRRVLHDLLRVQLAYEGIIITDCLEMHAISKEFGVAEGAVKAVEGGADIVLVSHTLQEQVAAIEALIGAVRSGRIQEEQIDVSVKRILALKHKRHVGEYEQLTGSVAEQFGTAERKDLIRQLTEKSITLVKDEQQLPLNLSEPTLVIWPEVRHHTQVDEPIVQAYTLGPALAELGANVKEFRIATHPTEEDIQSAIQLAAQYKQVVVVTYNAVSELHEGQVEIVRQIAARNDVALVVASTRNPYDLNQFSEVKTYLCCYENRPMTMSALAKVLTGQLKAQGKLPVTLSPEYSFGMAAQ
ncbi:beta-N-acetylhexosaminidase [Paenibacillus selenitireducens]|uniref:Beta-N-acetylhexosaminidase n=1 Tax=Paenibacillus selenitireducens TaxID=1324314 RepID=A0A1T2XN58_9BACL|nr:glycoside hydrolase family 3 protein [Paenibacillus selenitireducens]OPA81309.1 beta-N-acetylhexosaminidase [Paenibacillus selenitireducens]